MRGRNDVPPPCSFGWSDLFRYLNSLFLFLPCLPRPVSNFTFTLPNCRSLINLKISVASSLRTHLCNSYLRCQSS